MISIHKNINIKFCMYLFVCIYIHIYTPIHVHTYMCVFKYLYIYIFIYTYICVYMLICKYVDSYTYIHIYMYIHMYIHTRKADNTSLHLLSRAALRVAAISESTIFLFLIMNLAKTFSNDSYDMQPRTSTRNCCSRSAKYIYI